MTKTTLAAKAILLLAAIPTVMSVAGTAVKKVNDFKDQHVGRTRQAHHERVARLNEALAQLAGVRADERPDEKTILFPGEPDPEKYYKDLRNETIDLTPYYRDASQTGQKGETQ
ncbi:MAG: hypothetical protein A4E57_02473 [Syntrophorhabdaceae bacterium PtaU1.Bin034]|nr:MAG: hypothetical protein A4E57_02473 [Syntrophorhabdaceae bacterium PtaU1.Bin034]